MTDFENKMFFFTYLNNVFKGTFKQNKNTLLVSVIFVYIHILKMLVPIEHNCLYLTFILYLKKHPTYDVYDFYVNNRVSKLPLNKCHIFFCTPGTLLLVKQERVYTNVMC